MPCVAMEDCLRLRLMQEWQLTHHVCYHYRAVWQLILLMEPVQGKLTSFIYVLASEPGC